MSCVWGCLRVDLRQRSLFQLALGGQASYSKKTCKKSESYEDPAPPSGAEPKIAAMATARRGALVALLLLPGALAVYAAFHGGGFFAGTQGKLALLLAL